MGDPILRLWMGPSYALGTLVAVLALGHLPGIVHQPVWNILVGMNMHGRFAVASLVAGVVSVILCALALGPLHGGLSGAALALTVPLVLLNFVYTAAYACRVLQMSYWRYLLDVWRMPLACGLPFILCLLGVRWMFDGRPGVCFLVGMGAGGLVLSAVYWRWAIPPETKTRAGAAIFRTWSRVRGLDAA
jgi:O-antigen/teichoic acid export membrane protein